MTGSERERVQEIVDDLERVLENGSMGRDARDDLEEARDYAAGALPIWSHGGQP